MNTRAQEDSPPSRDPGQASPRAAWSFASLGEWVLAVAATLAATWLIFLNARWAGPLWRDEAHLASFAAQPGWSDLWANLKIDSYPIGGAAFFRIWQSTGWGASDEGLRAAGAFVALVALLAFWIMGWRLHRSPPTVALALVAFNPIWIHTLGAVRPYGPGLLFLVLCAGEFALLAQQVTWQRWALATLWSLLAVHCLYHNATFVLALGLAAAFAAALQRRWAAAAAVLGVGAVAALSLLPYLPAILAAGDWSKIMAEGSVHRLLWPSLSAALSGDLPGRQWVAGCVLCGGLALAWWRGIMGTERDEPKRLFAIFVFTALVAGTIFYFVQLRQMELRIRPHYLLPWLAVAALLVDAMWGQERKLAWGRSALLLGVAALGLVPASRALQVRQTNIDIVAQTVERAAREGDLVVVQPWYLGPSFHRYYHGPAAWQTMPVIDDPRFTRYDQVKPHLSNPRVVADLLDQVRRTLSAGHTVWFVGALPHGPADPRYATPDPRWFEADYNMMWASKAGALLDELAATRQEVPLVTPGSINPDERISLEKVEANPAAP